MLNKPYTFLLLGRSGCGKGTQAKLLAEKFSISTIISTGKLLRDVIATQSLAGRRIEEIFAHGELPPDWLVCALWQRELMDRVVTGEEGVIFDGMVRRPEEARVLYSVLSWYSRQLQPILIDISEEESIRRLKARGRFDDTEENIRNRLLWFDSSYMKSIDFLKENFPLIVVDGTGSRDEVFQRIIGALEE